MWLNCVFVVYLTQIALCNTISTTPTPHGDLDVYSFANVVSSGDGMKSNQLIIASGEDGKYHYVKKVNGLKEEGIWNGTLPSSFSSIFSDEVYTKPATVPDPDGNKQNVFSHLVKLFQDIGNSVDAYMENIQNAFHL